MTWHNAIELHALTDGMHAIMHRDRRVLLVRSGDTVRAFAGLCPHAGAKLDEGALVNGRIVCPWHMASFCAETGRLLQPCATHDLPRYAVRIADGVVQLSGPLPLPAAVSGTDPRTMLIVGAGAAGMMAAEALRDAGFSGRLAIVAPEQQSPIDRTALSKMALGDSFDPATLPLWTQDDRDRLALDWHGARVVELDHRSRIAHLSDGQSIAYDSALIATGGVPKRPDLPGAALPGVYVLRDAADALAIRAGAEQAGHAVIVGASFIGLEAASALRGLGLHVTVLERSATPLAHGLGEQIASAVKRLHERNGTRFIQARATAIAGERRASHVRLDNGEVLEADLVLFGTGIQAATDFIHGLPCADKGALPVDRQMRAAPGLCAAGDAAQPTHGARHEHWRTAQQQARIAAQTMLAGTAPGQDTQAPLPFFWTYHFGQRIDCLGTVPLGSGPIIDGDLDRFDFLAWFVKDGCVQAVISCGRDRDTALLSALLEHKTTLADARAALSR